MLLLLCSINRTYSKLNHMITYLPLHFIQQKLILALNRVLYLQFFKRPSPIGTDSSDINIPYTGVADYTYTDRGPQIIA